MNEFQFNCPKCGQNILAAAQWSGRAMTCPSCATRMIIPPEPSAALKKSGRRPMGMEAPPAERIRVKVPPKTGGGSTSPRRPKKSRPSLGPGPATSPRKKGVNDA